MPSAPARAPRPRATSPRADHARWERLVAAIVEGLHGLPHVTAACVCPSAQAVPRAQVDVDEEALGLSAFAAIQRLLAGEPRVPVAAGARSAGATPLACPSWPHVSG